jgi:hypothetical protein
LKGTVLPHAGGSWEYKLFQADDKPIRAEQHITELSQIKYKLM